MPWQLHCALGPAHPRAQGRDPHADRRSRLRGLPHLPSVVHKGKANPSSANYTKTEDVHVYPQLGSRKHEALLLSRKPRPQEGSDAAVNCQLPGPRWPGNVGRRPMITDNGDDKPRGPSRDPRPRQNATPAKPGTGAHRPRGRKPLPHNQQESTRRHPTQYSAPRGGGQRGLRDTS